MAVAKVNDVRLFYQRLGARGDAVVCVHGSWDSHADWDLVAPRLAETYRVLTYDRRGHSESERPPGQGSVHEDVADLAGLIEQQQLAPAWVIGNSFGASIMLRLAGARPDLVRGCVGHEPPLFGVLVGDGQHAEMLAGLRSRIDTVAELIAAGDHASGAEQFVETVALGPGVWPQLTPESRDSLVTNAPTFLDEANDPEQFQIDLDALRRFSKPTLLTLGDQSPPIFAPVVAKLAAVMPHSQVASLPGAGHVPHLTHPEVYVELVDRFISQAYQ